MLTVSSLLPGTHRKRQMNGAMIQDEKKIGNSEQGSGLFRVIPVADIRSRS